VPQVRPAASWAFVAIAAAIVIGIMNLLAGPASAAPLAGAQNGVGVVAHSAGQRVGFHETVLAGQGRATAPSYDQIVVGSGVGAEDVGLSGKALARQLGREGQAAIPGAGNTTRILLPGGVYCIPDILDPDQGIIGEVKNVQSLSYTSQLRDYSACSQQNGLDFNLYLRESKVLSGPLQDAVNAGVVNLFRGLP